MAISMRMAALLAIVIATGVIASSVAGLGLRAPANSAAAEPAWTEVKWPFPMDQWGLGKAFVCPAADCGSKIDVYVRPKIGFCNCATGVSDDDELERVGDTELVSPNVRGLGRGRPIKVGWMAGLIRSYRVSDDDGQTPALGRFQ